jgi:hypothetical protein
MGAESGTNRVAHDVATRLGEMFLGLYAGQTEPTFEEMTTSVVTAVERLRIEPVQPLHLSRQSRVRDAKDQVIVICHQAVRKALPARSCQQRQEPSSIVIVIEEISDTARRHVVIPGRNGLT